MMKLKIVISAEIDEQGNILKVSREFKTCRGGPSLTSSFFQTTKTPAWDLIHLAFDLDKMRDLGK